MTREQELAETSGADALVYNHDRELVGVNPNGIVIVSEQPAAEAPTDASGDHGTFVDQVLGQDDPPAGTEDNEPSIGPDNVLYTGQGEPVGIDNGLITLPLQPEQVVLDGDGEVLAIDTGVGVLRVTGPFEVVAVPDGGTVVEVEPARPNTYPEVRDDNGEVIYVDTNRGQMPLEAPFGQPGPVLVYDDGVVVAALTGSDHGELHSVVGGPDVQFAYNVHGAPVAVDTGESLIWLDADN